MSRWDVEPARLRSGGARIHAAGEEINGIGASVAGALSAIAGASGHPDPARAGGVAAGCWRDALRRLGSGTAVLGRSAAVAAAAYGAADHSAAEAFGGGGR